MLTPLADVSRFLEEFARQTAEDDIPALVSNFADPFLFAGPTGSPQPVRSADFAAALPKRKAFFAGLGARPTELVRIDEQRLDERYVLARTTWRFSFLRENASLEQFEVDSSFLIDRGQPGDRETTLKILVYLNHQDLMQMLRDGGILPN